MIGAIIGDIIGSRWEFNPTNDYNFEWLSDHNDYTDDTICTIAVADALLHGRSFKDSIHDWCRRYRYPMGSYGGRFAMWVDSDHPEPYHSFGNGSAMRVSAIAHWYDTEEQVLEAAAQSAMVSHDHPEGIKGAQSVALAIFKALQYNRECYQSAPEHIDDIIDDCVAFSGYDINMSKASVLNRFDETCQGTVPVALKIISISRNFEDAIRLAVSLGADADTLGAIVGSIAEAIWGIPPQLSAQVKPLLPDDMLEVLDQFYTERSLSYKLLIDRTFSEIGGYDTSLDLLEDEERKEMMAIVDKRRKHLVNLMEERGRKRDEW